MTPETSARLLGYSIQNATESAHVRRKRHSIAGSLAIFAAGLIPFIVVIARSM